MAVFPSGVQSSNQCNQQAYQSEFLSRGYKTASAVIAGTVLETALRELCDRNTVPLGKLDK
jgi:hypothetical protein